MIKRLDVISLATALAMGSLTAARASFASGSGYRGSAAYALTMDSAGATSSNSTARTAAPEKDTALPAPSVYPSYTPIMQGLNHINVDGSTVADKMNNLHLVLDGYIEGGYTGDIYDYNTRQLTLGSSIFGYNISPSVARALQVNNPADQLPRKFGRVFNREIGNHAELNQVDLSLSRAIDFSDPAFRNRGWDIGG